MTKRWGGWFRLVALAFCVVWLVGLASPAWADPYTIDGVRVDVRDTTAVKARETALMNGQVDAFHRLLTQITTEADRAALPQLSPEDIEALVSDFSVSNEKSSATRYIATLSVHFDPTKISAFLKAYGVAATVKADSETVILLGVYRAQPGEPAQLWEEGNPWRQLLTQTAVSRALFPVVVPLGDILDMAEIPVDKALSLDVAAMEAVMARYGADAVVVADAVWEQGRGASLQLKRYPRPLPGGLADFESPVADDPAVALGDLAAHAVLAIARGAKVQVAGTMVGEGESLAVLVPVQSLGDWVRVDRTLRALPEIKAVVVRATRTDVVQAAVRYVGDRDALRAAITRIGFTVAVHDGYWEVIPNLEPATPVQP